MVYIGKKLNFRIDFLITNLPCSIFHYIIVQDIMFTYIFII